MSNSYDEQVIPTLAKNKHLPVTENSAEDLDKAVSPDTSDQKTKAGSDAGIFMTEDQKIMVEPWNTIFGSDSIKKLFSKKFSDKEKGLQECENILKSSTCNKTRDTLKVSCQVANKAIQDKLLAVNLKGIGLLETTFAMHANLQFEGSAQLVSRIIFGELFAKVGD